MDKLHQNILKFLRKSIVDDMDVYNGIINPLKAEYILREEDVAKIQSGISKEERAQILLDILPSRGPYAFDIFRQALRHHYIWLSEDMDRLEASGKTFDDVKYTGPPTLPPMSPLTVVREKKFFTHASGNMNHMEKLRNALEKLDPDGYIVLHGMKGFGKSCLTASTLKDTKLVRTLFYNEVYWIKFGYERSIDEEVLIQLNRLYHLVKNLDTIPELLKPEPLKESLIHFLKHHFNKECHRHALLILDDVCDKKIIEAFDFECKTLVITADIDVLWGKRPTVIMMNDGFTEAETLGLFAKVLDTDVGKLPLEAKRIHEECKGMPLLIAMFSAQFEEFKDDMKLRPDRWKYYLNCLKTKDARNKVMREFFEKQEAIFHMCIDRLPVEMKKRYEELAIFSEDVNIMPQTLEILWEEGTFQVEEMMLDLCHKSLAAKQWNVELRSYIYGVHDLLLCHLRKNISAEKLVEMHKSLIEKYRKYCNGDFSKLPSDNYSHSYIGHHLEQAKLYDEFPNIYLNFKFIQAMINHTGLSNFLIDLENYKKYITKDYDPEYVSRVTDLEKFLEEQAGVIAEHRRKKCLDIIQIAMNHPYEGYIRDTAIKLATQKLNTLYLSHDKKLGNINFPYSEEVSTKVYASCFAYDPNLILMGTDAGEIFLWDSITKKLQVYNGHKKECRIVKIIISSEGDCFLSLTDTGIVKLFLLHDEYLDENQCPIQSPRQKQTFWSGIFSSNVPQDDSFAVFQVPDEIILDMAFGHDDNYIAVCTNKGTIRVWDRRGNMLSDYSHNPQSSYLKNIAFTMQSELLHIMDEINGVLISYGRCGNEFSYISQYNPGLQGKKIIFFRNVPERQNSLFIVTEDKAIYIKWFRSPNDQLHSYNKQVRANVENKKTIYVCAALTYDGQYLVLADSEGFINVWNTDVGYQPIATYKKRVSSLDTYWVKEEGYHIICGSENRLLHRWKLPIEETQNSIRKPLFDAVMQPFDKVDIVAMETLSNSIVVLHGNQIVAESDPVDGKILNLILSPDGKKLVYVTEKGVVTLFDVKSKKGIRILKLPQAVEFVKILNIENNYIVVCRETDDNLKVWQNVKVTYLIEHAGYIISIHEVNEKCVATVSRNGVVTIWSINGTTWLRLDRLAATNPNVVTSFSCLSYWKNFLAVLNENKGALLYKLQEDTSIVPVQIKITEYLTNEFLHKLTCCEISQNEYYLAIGFETGDVSIIDIQMREELYKLSFHTTPVTQLCWAPSNIGVPILLSVNADELVWWNIALATYNIKQKRRSRGGINRSVSSPSVSGIRNFQSKMTTSRSADTNVSNVQNKTEDKVTNGTHQGNKYWMAKIGKSPDQPALLAVVELPPNFLAKVCISTDFTKFFTVDIYGSISTFKLFGYP